MLFGSWEQLDRWCVGDCMLVYDFSAGEVLQGYPGHSEDETVAGE
jgi:hypothetical protein